MTDTLTITRPDDWHIHFRDGAAMQSVLPDTARVFGRAIAMPNLKPPVVNVADAAAYRERLLAAAAGTSFEPLMTLYLTDNTPPEEIRRARESGFVHAVKYYPAGATTNSDSGVTELAKAYKAIAAMEEVGMPLLLHGEVVDPEVDVFDREAVFIERHLIRLLRDFPTAENRAGTHHHAPGRRVRRGDAGQRRRDGHRASPAVQPQRHVPGGIRPHMYCLPVLKREQHRQALVAAAISGNPKFFLGTDSAPHAVGAKETACGCAGIYSAHAAIELYAEAFEDAGALDKLEAFASFYGADFYGLPRHTDTITLKRESWDAPAQPQTGRRNPGAAARGRSDPLARGLI